jgi:hypothetical protein
MDLWGQRNEERRADTAQLGTRFRIFPQSSFIPGYEHPETVWISTPPDRIRPGPADQRMYVVDPLVEKRPYEFPYLPPYAGALHPPAVAGPDGHFDHLDIGSREFQAAHVFACARRVLDICESYIGREIPWFFAPTYKRLEIVPKLRWDNAQSGYGFLELGEDDTRNEPEPFALSFDAVAHEVGHLVIFGVMGLPRAEPPHQYYAYHEAVADFISLIALLHFDTALDLVLRRTRGNLLMTNELDRFAETADEKQVRLFSHSLKMGDVSNEVHDLAKPFGGALFDLLIEVYQALLYERGLSDLHPSDFWSLRDEYSETEIEKALATSIDAYETRHFAFKSVLEAARDIVGEVLVKSWEELTPDRLDFRAAAAAMITASERCRAEAYADRLRDNFAWRRII